MSLLKKLFQISYTSLITSYELEDPASDRKSGVHIGQYTVSSNAIYRPDGYYLPRTAITQITHDKGSVHVTGC